MSNLVEGEKVTTWVQRAGKTLVKVVNLGGIQD